MIASAPPLLRLAAAAALLGSPPHTAQEVVVTPATTAFVHVDVAPLTTEAVLRDQTVLVRGERIFAVGPATQVDVPEDALVIDGRGKWLMPGLADMHVHTWEETEQLVFLAYGVTTVRNMFGSPQHVEWRDEIAAGERLGPTLYTAGPIVDGDPPVWPGSLIATTREEGEAAVAQHVAGGYDFVKVYERLPLEAYEGVVAAAAEAGLPVMGHVPAAVGLDAVLSSGQRTIEHLDKYEYALSDSEPRSNPMFALVDAQRAWAAIHPERTDATVSHTLAAGVWNCPTLVVMQKFLTADQMAAEFDAPYMRTVAPEVRMQWRGMGAMRSGLAKAAHDADAGRALFTGALASGGARLLLGTDQGNPFVAAGSSLHDELANFVAAGLTPYQALRAGTVEAAACLGEEREFGQVVPGLRADLLLLEANPLEDVTAAQRRVGVMARGRWLPEAELRARMAELEQRFAADVPPAAPEPERD